jgi:hypothetical protein
MKPPTITETTRRPVRGVFAILAAVVLAAITLAVSTGVGGGNSAEGKGPLDAVRRATAKYRNVDRATDAGYVQFFGCVHEPLNGAMGMHFVNATLVGDTVIDIDQPEALMYEMRPNGTQQLVGVEYIVFQEAWDAANTEPPQLFDQPLNLVATPNRYGIPAFYELHAWAWKANPNGDHQDWNPKVLCPNTEGHTH